MVVVVGTIAVMDFGRHRASSPDYCWHRLRNIQMIRRLSNIALAATLSGLVFACLWNLMLAGHI